jgi:hypothetical protein
MSANLRKSLAAAFLASTLGCSRATAPSGPVEPGVAEALTSHWQAIKQGDWQAAYGQLHPNLKSSGLTLKRFIDLHAKHRGTPGFPDEIRITGSDQMGEDVVVSYDLLVTPPGGGESVPVSPRRRATLQKAGDSWRLATHDILAAMAGGP